MPKWCGSVDNGTYLITDYDDGSRVGERKDGSPMTSLDYAAINDPSIGRCIPSGGNAILQGVAPILKQPEVKIWLLVGGGLLLLLLLRD